MDVSIGNRTDWERRRKLRLAQVRGQSKAIAKTIRDRVYFAVETKLEQHETARAKTDHKFKSLALSKLKSDFNYLIQDIGSGYSVASVQPDPNILIAEKRLINRCKAISRGTEAEKRQKRVEEEQQIDQEIIERRVNFNKTVEKIRSALITSVAKVDNINNQAQSINQHNKCFLIPSQVTLNESNIMNWNNSKKISKPWSMVIDSNVDKVSKFSKPIINCDNKENDPNVLTLTKLETDIKNYETLVTELNNLSTKEQKIRNNLSTNNLKDVLPVPCKNNIPFAKREKCKHDKITSIKVNSSDCSELNEEYNLFTEKRFDESNSSSSLYISSSLSSISNKHHVESIMKKTIHFKNEVDKKINEQSSSKLKYNKKLSPEKPLRNINNIIQRIKSKKQLLAKEIASQSKTLSSVAKTSPLPKRCADSNVLHKEKSINCTEPSKLKSIRSISKTSPLPKRRAAGNVLCKEKSINCTEPTKLKSIRSIPKTSPLPKRRAAGNVLCKEKSINCIEPTKLKSIRSIPKRCPANNDLFKESSINCINVTEKNTKTSPLAKRCASGNDFRKESPKYYAKLPDSFYNNQLQSLKEQISKNKLNPIDSKCSTSLNMNLMDYINLLLKMTPSDIENLSVSSCSSIKLEESILQHSKTSTQYNSELLNCISKCLNSDISELSQDIEFDSPKSINLLNKLQELTNYYLEKTHDMKNICNEPPHNLNELNTKTKDLVNHENNSMNVSSNSSVDEEYMFQHLNTLLLNKGLIKSDKEWPMFENLSDNDDNRSLTDQLLDIYPRKSDDN
ncbi:Hypothetical protein CINCED_3A003432 [Cinara cedri]|uniref:Uncharacterized protein n=1 Tax=Cinara cedri TaxID=506608 RepID=A0A5E4M030_9HEMI|nr:Hypothetical protein CINCED_3A003432 [Cinara cedri]